ncbi:MAG: hypothetical protein JNK05_14360 [Myxococcales bacterium]|nr:hypothetical protein [Myxococcales bacterium]
MFERFRDLLPLRSRGAFHWVSAVDVEGDGRRVALAIAGPSASREGAKSALARCRDAHQVIEHRRVPKVILEDLDAERPWIAFDCAAVCDGIEFVRALGEHDARIPYRAADGFIASLREALSAAHAQRDARGRPLCLGRISLGNLLFDAKGDWYLVGFGANLAVEKDNGSIDGAVVFFQAQELYGGGEPTPIGDYVALLQFRRSVVPYAEIPPSLARILRGEIQPDDLPLLADLQWTEQRMISSMPHDRPTLDEALEVAERIRVALGSTRDEEGMRAFVEALLTDEGVLDPRDASASHAAPSAVESALQIGRECEWILIDGEKRRLGTPLRRILAALVAKHRSSPGAPLTVWELLAAGWPGEDPLPEAGANRVYVTVNRLRAAGLRDLVERFDNGYRLAPSVLLAQ